MPVNMNSKAACAVVRRGDRAAVDRKSILVRLFRQPGMTREELSIYLNLPIQSICPRVFELMDCGAVVAMGVKKNPNSGRGAGRLYVSEKSTPEVARMAAANE